VTPGRRRIPATRAEVITWWWGARQAEAETDEAMAAAVVHGHPGSYLDPATQQAWDRLGPRDFWAWAQAGFRARTDELEGG
jgi:hypothetical protein